MHSVIQVCSEFRYPKFEFYIYRYYLNEIETNKMHLKAELGQNPAKMFKNVYVQLTLEVINSLKQVKCAFCASGFR